MLSVQVMTMRDSRKAWFTGIALAVGLVLLLQVINSYSGTDPKFVMMAMPFVVGGVVGMLFVTQRTIEYLD
jgi:multidrug efflux pump subunit AcrB